MVENTYEHIVIHTDGYGSKMDNECGCSVISGYGICYDVSKLDPFAMLSVIEKSNKNLKEKVLSDNVLSKRPINKLSALDVEGGLLRNGGSTFSNVIKSIVYNLSDYKYIKNFSFVSNDWLNGNKPTVEENKQYVIFEPYFPMQKVPTVSMLSMGDIDKYFYQIFVGMNLAKFDGTFENNDVFNMGHYSIVEVMNI